MKMCPIECPCRTPKSHTLTVAERIQIDQNHFPEEKQQEEHSAIQGEIHFYDWHEAERS